MKTISYIIGFRSSDEKDRRLDNLILTIEWLIRVKHILLEKINNINLKIIIVEQDSNSKFIIPEHFKNNIEHLFIYNAGFYNRGWAFNVGYKIFKSDYYFFADGDIIMNPIDIINVFKSCFQFEAVNPYLHIYDSTENFVFTPPITNDIATNDIATNDIATNDIATNDIATNDIATNDIATNDIVTYDNNTDNIKYDPLCWIYPSIFSERPCTCFSGGIMGIKEGVLEIVSGWDERFRGRGWEDYAFTTKLKLFLYSMKTYNYLALHLWHPWEIHTTRDINQKLNDDYENYNFSNYVNLIQNHSFFGSPVKYSSLHPIKTHYKSKHISNNRYEYGYSKYNNARKLFSTRKLTFLFLCDQITISK